MKLFSDFCMIDITNLLHPMYNKQEASLLRQQFWTAFGMYMQPIPSADGVKINWVNYKTRQKHIAFKMEALNDKACIAVVFTHQDPALQQFNFEKFLQLKKAFRKVTGDDWQWQLHTVDEQGKMISRIYLQLDNVTILDKAQWPQLISFFKSRVIALDQFWSEYKYAFEA